jgi:hypothetical protein
VTGCGRSACGSISASVARRSAWPEARVRHRAGDQAVAVLYQRMTHETQPRLLARTFAEEPGIGIGGRGTRVVPAMLAMNHCPIPLPKGTTTRNFRNPFLAAC